MASFLSKIFGKKAESVVGVDIGSSSIKVVQLSRKNGQAILETYGELALGPYAGVEVGRATNLPPEKVSEALVDLIREAKITSTSGGLAIPFGASLISAIEMPAVGDAQLAQMIPLEARKYIPVPISEVMLDWIIVPKDTETQIDFNDKQHAAEKTDKIDILLVAIHNESISRYQTIVNQASLSTSFFEIEVFSTIRSVLDQEIKTQMIIDMGAASTKIYIVERGVIRSSHIINRGAQDITMALSKSLEVTTQDAEVMKRDLTKIPENREKDVEEVFGLTLDYIFSEAHHVLLMYQKKTNKDVSRVVMVGGGARLEGILQRAETHFQTEVVLGDPFGKTEAPAFLELALKKTGPEFAVAVGIALRKLQESK